jgi:hypothetical protein
MQDKFNKILTPLLMNCDLFESLYLYFSVRIMPQVYELINIDV